MTFAFTDAFVDRWQNPLRQWDQDGRPKKAAWARQHDINPNTFRRVTNDRRVSPLLDRFRQHIIPLQDEPGNGHKEIVKTQIIYGQGEAVPVDPRFLQWEGARRAEGYYPGRIAVMDIECASLKANGEHTILSCMCVLPLDNNQMESYSIKFEDFKDEADEAADTRLLRECILALDRFDILIGHYIKGFDEGWLRTRALRAGLPLGERRFFIDTLDLIKAVAPATYKGLGMVGDLLDVPYEKTPIYPNAWSNIFSRDRARFDETHDRILFHCQQDVLGTREIAYVLFPLARSVVTIKRGR